MFQQFKHIDTAFRNIRLFCIVFLICVTAICIYDRYSTSITLKQAQQKIYVLVNGKLLDAMGIERSDSLRVRIRDHVKMFHYYFYSLQPDDAVNKRHLTAALYLADNSAKQEFNNLSENGYYSNIISANVSQEVQDYDSIQVDINQIPYFFRYFGKIRITRATSILTRSLVTEGYIRTTDISDHNPQGFLIERWKVDANKDLSLEKR